MKIGFLTDLHLGYSHGTKTTSDGVNVREQDVINAAHAAVGSILRAGVDVIVDCGDLAHVPTPKKRAVSEIFRLIDSVKPLQFISVNGNHTMARSSSDIHLYQMISEQRPNFVGVIEPTYLESIGGYLIPYGTAEEIKSALDKTPTDAKFIAGHWACDDVPFLGDHVQVADLPDIPVFLGHYHTRKINMTATKDVQREYLDMRDMTGFMPNKPWNVHYDGPAYIGATERFAWGEHNNPNGVAIWDSELRTLEFIDIKTRPWVDIAVESEQLPDLGNVPDGAITRLSITAPYSEYNRLDFMAIKKKLSNALEIQIRRRPTDSELVQYEYEPSKFTSVLDSWREHVTKASIPRGVSKRDVERTGSEAIRNAQG